MQAALRVKELQDRLREQNTELERVSCTDALTGLANRRGLEAQLQRLARGARRHGYDLTVLIADVDHFKRVNDSEGHEGGDRVLAAVAATPFPVGRDRSVPVTVGIGGAAGDAGCDVDVLLREADHALYAAKQEGRNTVRIS